MFGVSKHVFVRNQKASSSTGEMKTNEPKQKCYRIIRIVSLTFFLTSLAICCIINSERIVTYLKAPTTTNTKIIQENYVQFPPIVLCRYGFTKANFVRFFHRDFKNRCLSSPECKDLPENEMINYPLSRLNLDVNGSWDKYGILPEHIDHDIYCPYLKNRSFCDEKADIKIKKLKTVLGTCVEFYFAEYFEFHGYYTYITLNILPHWPLLSEEFTNKTPDIWLYIPESKKYSLHEIFYSVRTIPKFCQTETELTVQVFHFLNTKSDPCVEEMGLVQCFDNCLQLYLQEKVPCNLPFFGVDGYNTCNTFNETVLAYNISYQIYYEMTLSKCNCKRCCNDTVITSVTKMEQPEIANINFSTSISFRYSNNLVTLTVESYQYSLTALVSDIGGNVGFFLGFSVLATFNIFINAFKKAVNKCLKLRKRSKLAVRRVNSIA